MFGQYKKNFKCIKYKD